MVVTNDFEQQAKLAALDAAIKITSMDGDHNRNLQGKPTTIQIKERASEIYNWLITTPTPLKDIKASGTTRD